MRTLEELKSELSMPTSFQVQLGFPVRQHTLSLPSSIGVSWCLHCLLFSTTEYLIPKPWGLGCTTAQTV